MLKHPQGYYLNHSGHADLRAWHIGYPKEVFGADAAQLLDGLFFDGMGYIPQGLRNTNVARNDAWFGGKMQLGDEARALYGGLNGGEVWGNAALGITARYANFTYDGQLVDFRTSMDHLDTGFLEVGNAPAPARARARVALLRFASSCPLTTEPATARLPPLGLVSCVERSND